MIGSLYVHPAKILTSLFFKLILKKYDEKRTYSLVFPLINN